MKPQTPTPQKLVEYRNLKQQIADLEQQLEWEQFRAKTFQQILISACSNNQQLAEQYGVVPGYPVEELTNYWSAVDKVFHERKAEILKNTQKTE